MNKSNLLGLLSATAFMGGRILRRVTQEKLENKVIVITGGTSGLGFALMQELLKEKAKVSLCARKEEDLQKLKQNYPEAFTMKCDVGNKAEVFDYIQKTIQYFGRIDIVINNAGIIMVGPMEGLKREEYEKAMDVMYWGIVNTTLAVVPHMKQNGKGQIVNITSVGGKVSIPHLLPYSAAKFAAVGFSEGITPELRNSNIFVTTIVPGLMRTGSYKNALFQKGNRKSYKLFSAISSAPFLTVSAEKAARRVILAMKQKRAVKVIGFQARALIELHHFFPNTLLKAFFLTTRALPSREGVKGFERGEKIRERSPDAEVPVIKKMGKKAETDFQEQARH